MEGNLFFTVSYDAEGTALEKHSIPAEMLADSIRAVSDIISLSHNNVFGNEPPTALMINAPIKKGSVVVEFFMSINEIQMTLTQTLALIGIIPAATVVAAGAISLLDFLKNNGDAAILSIAKSPTNPENVVLEMRDNNQEVFFEEVSRDLALLIFNKKIRKQIDKLLYKPTEMYQDIKITLSSKDSQFRLSAKEALKFKWRPSSLPKIKALDKTITCAVEFDIVAFSKDKKWKIKYNNKAVWVEILDESFLEKVNNRQITFSKGQLFEVLLNIKTENPLTSDEKDYFYIEEVIGLVDSSQREFNFT